MRIITMIFLFPFFSFFFFGGGGGGGGRGVIFIVFLSNRRVNKDFPNGVKFHHGTYWNPLEYDGGTLVMI